MSEMKLIPGPAVLQAGYDEAWRRWPGKDDESGEHRYDFIKGWEAAIATTTDLHAQLAAETERADAASQQAGNWQQDYRDERTLRYAARAALAAREAEVGRHSDLEKEVLESSVSSITLEKRYAEVSSWPVEDVVGGEEEWDKRVKDARMAYQQEVKRWRKAVSNLIAALADHTPWEGKTMDKLIINQTIGVWMSSGTLSFPKCPGRIRFGHRVIEHEDGPIHHTDMIVECCGHQGHDGPHIHKIDAIAEYDNSEGIQPQLVDYPFVLTWTDTP